MTVASGDVVQWNFPDTAQFPHDVWVIAPGEAPNSAGTEVTDGTVSPGGESVSRALNQAGTWTFLCKVHSFVSGGEWTGMVGTAEVEPGDGPSGVDFTEYRINGGDWVSSQNTAGDDPFVTAFTVSEPGEYEVEYRSTDNAGNEEAVRSVEFEIEGEPEPEYCPRSDEFDGAALNGERWTVVRPDPTRLSVAGGSLNLIAPALDIFQAGTGLPNIVVQPLPDGGSEAWTFTTEMTWNPNTNFQNAGLIVYEDDDNYVKTGMVWNGSRNFELIKEVNGNPTFPGGATAAGAIGERYFMRLRSADGNAVEAEFSANGQNWTRIGTTGTNLDNIDDPMIGVYATASTAGGALEREVRFHSVTVDPECEVDTTAPETTVQLNGAAPVAGYTGGPVTATFSASDAGSGVARTEYRVDAGVWTTYDPGSPPVVSGAGQHTIEYRSADVAGNLEAAKSVTFTITTTSGGGGNPPPPRPRRRRAAAGRRSWCCR